MATKGGRPAKEERTSFVARSKVSDNGCLECVMEIVQVLPKLDEFLRRHFIDGASSQVDSSERLSVLDPSTGNEIAGVANGGIQSVNAAVEAARRSLNGEWGAMRPADRERLLHNFSSVIEAYAEELAQLETINQGKSIHSGYR